MLHPSQNVQNVITHHRWRANPPNWNLLRYTFTAITRKGMLPNNKVCHPVHVKFPKIIQSKHFFTHFGEVLHWFMPRLKVYSPDLISQSQLEELEKLGIKTVESLVGSNFGDSIKKCGFSEKEFQVFRNALILCHSAKGVSLDEYFMSKNMTFNWFSTGCDK
jgi:hypothetical protein